MCNYQIQLRAKTDRNVQICVPLHNSLSVLLMNTFVHSMLAGELIHFLKATKRKHSLPLKRHYDVGAVLQRRHVRDAGNISLDLSESTIRGGNEIVWCSMNIISPNPGNAIINRYIAVGYPSYLKNTNKSYLPRIRYSEIQSHLCSLANLG